MRFSMGTLNRTPMASPTLFTSVMMAWTRARLSGSLPMASSVAPVSAETGLNEQLPHSLTQISSRIRGFCGAFRPPAIISDDSVLTRSLCSIDGSPSVKRSPSRCLTRPGAAISQAG